MVINELNNALHTLVESVSEVSHFIPEPSSFSEVTILSAADKKYWLKEILKEIKNLINKKIFIMYDPDKGDKVTPCMDVYKSNIQYYGSLDKLKF